MYLSILCDKYLQLKPKFYYNSGLIRTVILSYIFKLLSSYITLKYEIIILLSILSSYLKVVKLDLQS